MNKVESSFNFKAMSFMFKLRDLFMHPEELLKEVEMKAGIQVLDYGCGPGGYLLPLVELVGNSGKIYALDILPLAITSVHSIMAKNRLSNVETILSDCKTGLPDNSIDVVLLYDTFHDLNNPDQVLEELHRILKQDGVLSFSDHHLKEDQIISQVSKGGLFKLSKKGKRIYNFKK